MFSQKLNTKILFLFITLLVICLLAPAAGWAVENPGAGTWPQFQNDLHNDGLTTDPGPVSDITVNWQQQLGNTSMAGVNHTPLVAGGSVFALDAFGKAWAFDTKTGAQKWATQLSCTGKQFQLSTPVYNNGTLYAVTNDGHVYALDADSGNILWDKSLPLASTYSQLNTPVKYAGAKIYAGAWNPNSQSNEYYYCLDAATGNPGIGTQYQIPNTASGGGYYWAGACIVGKCLVFGSERSVLTCLDKDTGATLSTVNLKVYDSGAKEIRSSVSYDPNTNRVFLTEQSGGCWGFGLDPATGELVYQWHTNIGKISTSTPAVYNSRLYVGTGTYASKGGLYCLDEQTGNVLWNFMPAGEGEVSVPGVQASPAISVPDTTPYIYFVSIWENSLVYCLDQNGNQIWQFSVPNATYTTSSIAVADGDLYFGNDYGWLYALSGTTPAHIPVTGVSLDKTTTTVTIGATDTLTATVIPPDATNQAITWASDNTAVATVDQSGKVTGVAAGAANITVTTVDGGYEATCGVTVKAGSGGGGSSDDGKITVNMKIQDKNENIRFNENINVQSGKTVIDALMKAAEMDPAIDPEVEWDNPYIMGGYVWSIYGEESPWGQTSEGWIYLVNDVMPNKGAARYTLSDGDSILWKWSAMTPVTGVSLNKTAVTITVGATDTLTATVTPSEANQVVTWSSDKTSVATVNQNGKVTGVAAGSANVTVTTADGGYKATCAVTVQTSSQGGTAASEDGIALNKSTVTITVGATTTLTATVTPAGANQIVTWTSDNTAVATVDQNGKITGVSVGIAKITAATADNKYKAICVVTVQAQQSPQQVQQSAQESAASAFKDLPSGHWAREVIEYMVAGGYLKGYEDGTFRPDQPVTRAEFVTIMLRVLGLQEEPGKDIFNDVHTGDWYYNVVSTGFAQGLIAGYEDGGFGPNEPVTREQVSSIITRVLAQKEGQQSEEAQNDEILLQFKDAGEISDWARSAVAVLVSKDLIHGYEDGGFKPKSPATRAECVAMLRKLLP